MAVVIDKLQVGATTYLINHPSHYTYGRYEVIDVLEDWFPTDPLLWQVGKYIARCAHKGSELNDLRKAEFYLKRRIAKLEASVARPAPTVEAPVYDR